MKFFNKEIKLTSEPMDVSGILKNNRILYFKDEGKVVFKSCTAFARKANREEFGGRAIILTKNEAPKLYPKVFINSQKKEYEGETRTIILHVNREQHAFCRQQGNISAFLRSLIDREMQK